MNHLTTVIGPAPSELPFSELLDKLKVERARVRFALDNWVPGVGGKKAKKKKELSKTAKVKLAEQQLGSAGLDLDKALALLSKLTEEKKDDPTT